MAKYRTSTTAVRKRHPRTMSSNQNIGGFFVSAGGANCGVAGGGGMVIGCICGAGGGAMA
jgi:hypothetical protein